MNDFLLSRHRLHILVSAYLVIISSLMTVAHAQDRVLFIPIKDDPPVRLYYGSVTGAGTLETGNIESASRSSTGRYTLETGETVSGCAVTVTKGSQSGGSSNTYGNVNATVPATGTAISVSTRDSGGVLNNTDFHFIAICPR